MIIFSALMLPGPSERNLSINEEELEGSFRKWSTTNKGPEEVLFPSGMWGFSSSQGLTLSTGEDLGRHLSGINVDR